MRLIRGILALGVVALTFIIFYFILLSDLWGMWKFAASLILMAGTGLSLQWLLGVEGEYGLLLIRTRRGLGVVRKVAALRPELWKALADVGLAMGFGLSSLYMFKKPPRASIIMGIILILLFSQFIIPAAAPMVLELISLPAGVEEVAPPVSPQTQILILQLISFIILIASLLGGLALLGLVGLSLKALSVAIYIGIFAISLLYGRPNDILSQAAPGAAPVLPGINLPFVEGIAALIILLIVHEFSHGILACVSKIKLESVGIAAIGIIPIGAFIDPDEKALSKSDKMKQYRVLVAGSAANLLAALFSFLLILSFQTIVLHLYPSPQIGVGYVKIVDVVPGSPASGMIEAGERIISWQGENITSLSQLSEILNRTKEGDVVSIVTDRGSYNITAGENGLVGVRIIQGRYSFLDHLRELKKENGLLHSLYTFLGLLFVLNLLVGIVNLFPIPPFDGHRILGLTTDERIVKAISIFVVLCFLLNLIPWAWS